MKLSRIRRLAIESEVSTWEPWKQEVYQILRDNGQSVTMAHMFASRQAPRGLTDCVVMTGQRRIRDLPPKYRDWLCSELRRKGAVFSTDDVYMPSLGRDPNGADPNAVIGVDNAMGRIRKVSEEMGVDSDGVISVKGSKFRKDKPVERVHKLHPRIVERNRQAMIAEDPSLAFKDQRELREAIVDKHASKS